MGDGSKTRSKSKQTHKPYAGFPLTVHPSGRWCKKIPKSAPRDAGKLYYFGPQNNWKSALEKYNRKWQYIIEGRDVPPLPSEGAEGRQR